MSPSKTFFIAGTILAPAVVLLAQPMFPTQPKIDPYQTQYLESHGPRLKVEPRPEPAPPKPSKFRFLPETRSSGQEIIVEPVIDRPGRAPRAVSSPVKPPGEFVAPTEEPKPKVVAKKKVETPEPVVAPRTKISTPKTASSTKVEAKVEEPKVSSSKVRQSTTKTEVVAKPKPRFLPSVRDSAEDEVTTAREIESEAVGTDTSDSLAVVADDGSFRSSRIPVRVTIDLREGYDSNVFTEPNNPEASWFSNIGARAVYEFGTARTLGVLDLSGGYTGYYDRSGDPHDFDLRFGGQVTHKVSPRLTLRASNYTAYEIEPDYGMVGGNNRRSGAYFYTNSEFGAAYSWTRRFSTDTSYKITGLVYTEDTTFGDSENRVEQTFAQSFRFLILPPTVAVLEYRLQLVDYLEQDFRDSLSNFVMVGLDHSFNTRLSGSFRVGAEFRSTDSTSPTDRQESFQTSPYFEGNLRYALGERSSAELRTRYGLEQSDVANDLDRETFRVGLAATHSFTPRISGSLTVDYNHSSYQDGTSFSEDTIDTSLGLRYTINRNYSLELSYLYSEVISGEPTREYTRNRTFLAARVQF